MRMDYRTALNLRLLVSTVWLVWGQNHGVEAWQDCAGCDEPIHPAEPLVHGLCPRCWSARS